jgi:hypothetical protein
MNIPIDSRLQASIRRIEARANAPQPIRQVRVPTIPKTPAYYKDMIAKARQFNEPYLVSVYKRAHKLSQEGKTAEIVRLLKVANATILKKRSAPRRKPKPQARRVRRINWHPQTLNRYILDYVEKVKKRKENFFGFLKRKYEAKEVYVPISNKWVRTRRH